MSKEIKNQLQSVINLFAPVKKEDGIPMSPEEVKFKSLLIAFKNKTISYRTAVVIVGGNQRLKKLMESGKVRGEKPDGSSNCTWLINAVDCFMNVRPRMEIVKNS